MYQRLLYVKLPIIIDYNNQNIIKNLQINKVASSMPSISVIIPSYNYESYMYEAIKSVLLQSLKDFELIIVDDGSTDDSMAVARSFAGQDQRITVLQHPDGKNHGLAATLQLGVAESKGEYIAFLEADDIWLSTCLEIGRAHV